MIREEGHYTIKRVEELPKRGNANFLYVIKSGTIDTLYRWLPNKSYESIAIGGGTSTDDQEAFEVIYDNATSGLTAINVQDAIDEIIAGGGATPDIEAALAAAPVHDSIVNAIGALGLGKLFAYSESNLDGVPSPNASIIGITKS